jgi:glycosyltransferase involved in cell wall biosynthesis
LPVAEAMALGTPVITACRGALAETAGGAALLVEPKDVAAIASALQRITLESDLHRRLSQAGLQNAKRFSPALFADALASLYGDLLAATPR